MTGGSLPVLYFSLSISHKAHLVTELQMRRPNKERYRLDRLLERKAKEGVMIYIIL